MARQKSVAVSELSPEEVQKLVKHKVYSRVQPMRCDKCSCTEGFGRRIFRVMGVRDPDHIGKKTEDAIRHHFYYQMKITWIFFHIADGQLYVDFATCPKCKATTVVYGIIPDEELTSHLAKSCGVTPEAMKTSLEAVIPAMRKKGGLN